MAAIALQEHNQYDRALEQHQEALEHAKRAGSVRIEGLVWSNQGNLHQRQGRLPEARDCLERAVQLCETDGDQRYAAISLGNLAVVWHDLGELELAEACCLRSLATHETHGNQRYEGIIEGNLGELALDRGDPRRALDHLSDAAAIHRDLGDPRLESVVRLSQAEAHRMLGEEGEARSRALDALTMSRRAGSRLFQLSSEALLIELSPAPRPLAGLKRLDHIRRALMPIAAGTPVQLAQCRMLRVWARIPGVTAEELGVEHAPADLLEQTRAYMEEQGMSPRSEVGRHLREAEAAWQQAASGA